jgi:hypothetical protein
MYVFAALANRRIVILPRWALRQMAVAGRMVMHLILLLFVLIIAAPFILYAIPIIIYVVPFILVGLALSCMADFFRHRWTTARH